MDKEEDIEELWKPIKGFEQFYEASNLGRIKSIGRIVHQTHMDKYKKERMMTPYLNPKKYLCTKLYDGFDNSKSFTIHKIIALTFLENPNNYIEVNHVDGNKVNNRVDNIEWCSRSHNVRETYRLGLKDPSKYMGSGNKTSKLTEEQVLSIREEYKNKSLNQRQLAIKYNVGNTLIGMIVHNQIWKHILNQQEV
jgi:hypothetical protein